MAPLPAHAAAEEDTVLTITGHLIDRMESLDRDTDAATLIRRYYALLPASAAEQAHSLQERLAGLIPDYQVAYEAADTAELNNVLSDMTRLWAALRTLHAREFTSAAIAELSSAYNRLYPTLALD